MSHAVLWLNEIEKDDAPLVGRKGTQLGELVQAGFPLADGFIITSYSYFRFLRENNIITKIKHLLGTVDFTRHDSLQQVSGHIQKLIVHEQLSDDLLHDIFHAYTNLSGTISDRSVVLTPSEDNKSITRSGQTLQGIPFIAQGETDLILQLKEIWASLFDPANLLQHHELQQDHFRNGMAVIVQKRLLPEVSGSITTINPATDEKNTLVIEAVLGMPQASSSGTTPDHYEVDKRDLKIIQKHIVSQEKKLMSVSGGPKFATIDAKQSKQQKLTDNQILELAALGKRLERHLYFPQEADWIVTGQKFIFTKIHPLTPSMVKQPEGKEPQKELQPLPLILKGTPASPGIITGVVKHVRTPQDAETLGHGYVLVTSKTDALPSQLLKKAAAIVTDTGGRSSHAALLAQSFGIPAVVGTETATTLLKDGSIVCVNGSKGEIYKGSFAHSSTVPITAGSVQKTATKIAVTLNDPAQAEKAALEHVESVGLLQADDLLKRIGVHPKVLIQDNKRKMFIDELCHTLTTTCRAFHQRTVVYQSLDLLSSAYRELKDGNDFEPLEHNPLLGFRGASRSLHAPELFSLEVEAIKKVRTEEKLKNLSLMLPFVRTVQELTGMKRLLSNSGLHRSPTFGLWLKVQTPVNCISLASFIRAGIDGVMIDLDELTMFMLCIDRNNSEVAQIFDEQNPAVLWALEHVIKTAHANHIPSSISGQSLAHQTELLEKLVRWGITSIAVPAPHVQSVRTVIADTEAALVR